MVWAMEGERPEIILSQPIKTGGAGNLNQVVGNRRVHHADAADVQDKHTGLGFRDFLQGGVHNVAAAL